MGDWKRLYLHMGYPVRATIPDGLIKTAEELQQELAAKAPTGWSGQYEYQLPIDNGDETDPHIRHPVLRVTADNLHFGNHGHDGWEPAFIHDREEEVLFDTMFLYRAGEEYQIVSDAPSPEEVVLADDEDTFAEQLEAYREQVN